MNRHAQLGLANRKRVHDSGRHIVDPGRRRATEPQDHDAADTEVARAPQDQFGGAAGLAGAAIVCHQRDAVAGAEARAAQRREEQVEPAADSRRERAAHRQRTAHRPGCFDLHPIDQYPDGYYVTDDLTDRAISMIRHTKASNPSKPFLMYFAHIAIHAPLQCKASDLARHRGNYDAGWDALRQARHERQVALGLVRAVRGHAP